MNEQPILSICIPTYNRSSSLDTLLAQLSSLQGSFGADVEVCVSDNHSTDDTPAVLEKWGARLPLRLKRNTENLGFSGNVHSLLDMATGRWMCIVGDDDLLITQNLPAFLDVLRGAREDEWILMPVVNTSSQRSSWLSDLEGGRYSPLSMLMTVWRKGIHDFGFIGCHAFSLSHRPLFRQIPLEYSDHWIHLNYWFLHLLRKQRFVVSTIPLVQVNTSVFQRPYSPVKWATLWSQRLLNFSNVARQFGCAGGILNLTLLREVLAWSQFKEWIKFFLRYPRTCAARVASVERKLRPKQTRPWMLRGVFKTLIATYYISSQVARRLDTNSTASGTSKVRRSW